MNREEEKHMLKDQTGIRFYNEGYLKEHPLNKSTVLDYFMLSPFYDPKSINQQCKDNEEEFTLKTRETKRGVEYVENTITNNKDIFIIAKYNRIYKEQTLLGYYYVFRGQIFQASNLFNLISSNLQSTANSLLNVVNILNEDNK